VAVWLGEIGLGKYGPMFAESDVTLVEDLRGLNAKDLSEIGVPGEMHSSTPYPRPLSHRGQK
jgi:hypothetical protein